MAAGKLTELTLHELAARFRSGEAVSETTTIRSKSLSGPASPRAFEPKR